jgi:hypothetical protein
MRPAPSPREHPAEELGRDLGLRAPDSVANPKVASETGTDIKVLRWTPLYVAAVAAAVIGGVGLVVLTVL